MIRTEEQVLHQLIYKRFQKALVTYDMIADGDRILVGLSGGKDSLCLLEMLAKRKRIFKPHFEVEAVHVCMRNVKYESDINYLETFSNCCDIKLHIITTEFDDNSLITDSVHRDATFDIKMQKKSACFLCSWYRRKALFRYAQDFGFNKIALGHHMDDIIHTAMLNQFFQGSFSTMPVMMEMKKMPLTIIRPLCLEIESDIREYSAIRQYKSLVKQCPYEKASNRTNMRRLFDDIESLNPEARYSIWHALEKEGKLIEIRNNNSYL